MRSTLHAVCWSTVQVCKFDELFDGEELSCICAELSCIWASYTMTGPMG